MKKIKVFDDVTGWKYSNASGEDIAISELTDDTIRVIQEHYMVPSDDEMEDLANSKQII